jgi:hypothetical protein
VRRDDQLISHFPRQANAIRPAVRLSLLTTSPPSPAYEALLIVGAAGYGHRGRLRVTTPFAIVLAITRPGAFPFSTQSANRKSWK